MNKRKQTKEDDRERGQSRSRCLLMMVAVRVSVRVQSLKDSSNDSETLLKKRTVLFPDSVITC